MDQNLVETNCETLSSNPDDLQNGGDNPIFYGKQNLSTYIPSNSYLEEWEQLLLNVDQYKDFSHLQTFILQGGLRSSKFRSVYWRIYLGVLDNKSDQWLKTVGHHREHYYCLKKNFGFLPNDNEETEGFCGSADDPLSLNKDSPWNRYFSTHSTRKQILQDVLRTFPELQFFHEESVRKNMVNILYCYSQSYPDIGYRQGMHEILAPLLFILHADQTAFEHAQEVTFLPEHVRDTVQLLMDRSYLEHDSYAIFEAVMHIVGSWYILEPINSHPISTQNAKHQLLQRQPFQNEVSLEPECRIPVLEKLNVIFHVLLKKEDHELYKHLEDLQISPQMYGLRWLRLLFGREYPLQDLLVVWDALFAIQNHLVLVHYIFVAMLIEIRELLLQSDYSECLNYLMRYPHVMDVNRLVDMALHLYAPSNFVKPFKPRQLDAIHHPTFLSRSRSALGGFTHRMKESVIPKISTTFSTRKEGQSSALLIENSSVTNPSGSSLKHSSDPLPADTTFLNEMPYVCSDVLDACARTMQSLLLNDKYLGSQTEVVQWHVTLAAIKLVRDTLRGDLAFDKELLALSLAQMKDDQQ